MALIILLLCSIAAAGRCCCCAFPSPLSPAALYMLVNAGVSVVVGVIVLAGVDISCAGMGDYEAACTSTQVTYGLLMALGASSVGLFAAINSALVSFAMPPAASKDENEGFLEH